MLKPLMPSHYSIIVEAIETATTEILEALGTSRKGSKLQQVLGEAIKQLVLTDTNLNVAIEQHLKVVSYLAQSIDKLTMAVDALNEKLKKNKSY